MGNWQTSLAQLNAQLVPPQLDALDPAAFAPGTPFLDTALYVGLGDVEYVVTYIPQMPTAVVEALRGAIWSALLEQPRSTVNVAWAPGSAYELTVWQTPAAPGARGAVSILLKTP